MVLKKFDVVVFGIDEHRINVIIIFTVQLRITSAQKYFYVFLDLFTTLRCTDVDLVSDVVRAAPRRDHIIIEGRIP